MSLTSYRAAPPRDSQSEFPPIAIKGKREGGGLVWPGGDLLFRRLSGSTMGAEGFHGRVRDGIGCLAPRYGHQAGPRTTARRGGRSGGHVRRRKKCLDEAASGSCRCTRAASGGTRFPRR